MTPLERFAAYAKGEAIDRLPCVPIVGNTAARVIGAKVSQFRGNGLLIAEAQIAAYRRFGYDVIRVFTDLYTLAEAMGARVHYPENETAYLEAPAIASLDEIARLKPVNPATDGNLPAHLEAMQRVVEAVGREVPVTGALTCPFTTASFLIGTENLVRLMLKRPEAVHRLCQLALESGIRYAEAIIDCGCAPSLTDPMSSSTVIGPRQFREFSYPYLKRLIEFIHLHGKSVTLHICGKTEKIWGLMADAGADCISIDNDASLAQARHDVGSRVRIMGNIKPSEVMLLGSPADVRQAVRECVATAGDSPRGYIVASGCSLPTETPFENIQAMMDAVAEIGWPPRLQRPG
ncbi:uroporphyrinogen decarboxylase family protein [Geobacter sp. SVR]|uniref:uroporphyrinogen decarboxylase family protein n=1 Tax=Geobacter sp. SVR TaxID=2495594 RepID=UPI00143EFE58|nr:uroporphyrinogen decarboxylase family protein [Geobacter sp. SVR]BCS54149.1 methylcobamide--CoM methyltransferase [Geobacter sp. SVR]GCF87711.1 methylcobamide--CoM methyltransferase [Geobacter sp. SVR]